MLNGYRRMARPWQYRSILYRVCFAAHTLQWKSLEFKPLYLDYGCLDKFVFLIEEKEAKERSISTTNRIEKAVYFGYFIYFYRIQNAANLLLF